MRSVVYLTFVFITLPQLSQAGMSGTCQSSNRACSFLNSEEFASNIERILSPANNCQDHLANIAALNALKKPLEDRIHICSNLRIDDCAGSPEERERLPSDINTNVEKMKQSLDSIKTGVSTLEAQTPERCPMA